MSCTRRQFLATTTASLAAPLFCGAPITGAATAADLKKGFLSVSEASRMTMHWYIFGPAWTVEESRRELRLMKEAHVGGVLIFPAYPVVMDDELPGVRNQGFLSEEYLQVYRAVTGEAAKLGLRVDVVLGTGWPYGGPGVALEDAARRIRRDKLPVKPGERFQLPAVKQGEQLVAAFYLHGRDAVDITSEASSNNLGSIITSEGEVQLFLSVPTQMQVKRAAVGAEGLVLDHYNRRALEKYLETVGKPLLEGAAPGSIQSVFCDSFEVYRATWTAAFPDFFRQKRGCDIVPLLPVLFDDAHPDARDLRCDFWRTLSEMAVEEFVAPLHEWAKRKGVTTQVEAYGTPPVSLAAYQHVDIPTGEHYEWKEFCSSRWASSGGRLAGKRVVLAEAWTWLGLPNRFADSMEQLKLCSDLHFLCGINALYGVTYAYSPQAAGSPGWVPYFGPHVNHTVPFWRYYSHLADYINRASYMLQQGKPVADVALYLPAEDCMADAGTEQLLLNWATRDRLSSNGVPPEFSLKNALHYESNVVKGILASGHSFDGIDVFTFATGVTLENGRLRKGDGDYSVLVLPSLKSIDVGSLEKIVEFVQEGGTLIAVKRLPDSACGLVNRAKNRERVQALVRDLFGPIPSNEAFKVNRYGKGRAIFAADDQGSFLKALEQVPSDVRFAEPCSDVGFVHRQTPELDLYFLANVGERARESDLTFRAGRKVPQLWDPLRGETSPVAVWEFVGERVRVPIRLAPLESKFVVFCPDDSLPLAQSTNLPAIRASGGEWGATVENLGRYYLQAGKVRREFDVSGIPAPLVLSPKWRLTFEESSSRPILLERLTSWTNLPEARFYSGKATYEAGFEFAEPLAKSALTVRLDLGRVCETADVYVNDQPAGLLWMRPHSIDISKLIQPGENRLRIDVTNLLINRILGLGPIDYSKVYAKYGRRFPAGDEWSLVREPFVSGLLGPVRLVFGKQLKIPRAL